jgi:hypothetical protein
MDDRVADVAGTRVYSDRWGPAEFWRDGLQRPCICDEERGVECTYHGRSREQSDEPRQRGRGSR